MAESLRMAIEVTAGIIPERPLHELTKQWFITGREWWSEDGRSVSVQGVELLKRYQDAADAYARSLRDPQHLNWVRVDWVYF